MKKVIGLVAIAAVVASFNAAYAGEWYVLGSVGQSKVDINKDKIDRSILNAVSAQGGTLLSANSSSEDRDTAYKIQLGYAFSPNFAIEGGYIDFGEFTYSGSGVFSFPAGSGSGSANASYKIDGWNVSAVGMLPINSEFSVFGKVGVIASTIKSNLPTNSGGIAIAIDAESKQNRTRPTVGAGVAYKINKNMAIRGEYEYFDKLSKDNDFGSSNVNLLSVGLSYKF